MNRYLKVLIVLVLSIFFVFILPSCGQVEQEPEGQATASARAENTPTKDVPTNGLSPWRHKEYWSEASANDVKHNGAYFACVHGIPVLYIRNANQFEIIPANYDAGQKAWAACREISK